MGRDKALLEVRPGKSQLTHAVELLGQFCESVVVCRGAEERAGLGLPEGVELLEDAPEVEGPMGGLLAAMRFAGGRPVLLVACDMPYLEADVLLQLVNRRDDEREATVFRGTDGLPEPMCAIYEPVCLAGLESDAAKGWSSLRRFLQDRSCEWVDPVSPEWLANMNDPETYAAARRRFQS